MLSNWHQAYLELTKFVAEHPAIEIKPDRIRLPDDVRPGFYQLFDKVRTALLEEKQPALLNEAVILNQNYIKVEKEATQLLGLDGVLMSPLLHEALHNPINIVRKGAFDPLFDLLQGKISTEGFEEKVSQNISASFPLLYQSGDEKWVILSLIELLEADKLFQVTLPKLTLYDAHKKGGPIKAEAPAPKESRTIS